MLCAAQVCSDSVALDFGGNIMHKTHFSLSPIGFLRSPLKDRGEAPNQGREGAHSRTRTFASALSVMLLSLAFAHSTTMTEMKRFKIGGNLGDRFSHQHGPLDCRVDDRDRGSLLVQPVAGIRTPAQCARHPARLALGNRDSVARLAGDPCRVRV